MEDWTGKYSLQQGGFNKMHKNHETQSKSSWCEKKTRRLSFAFNMFCMFHKLDAMFRGTGLEVKCGCSYLMCRCMQWHVLGLGLWAMVQWFKLLFVLYGLNLYLCSVSENWWWCYLFVNVRKRRKKTCIYL